MPLAFSLFQKRHGLWIKLCIIDDYVDSLDSTSDLVEPTNTMVESTNSLVEPTNTVVDSTSSLVEPTNTVVDSTNSFFRTYQHYGRRQSTVVW